MTFNTNFCLSWLGSQGLSRWAYTTPRWLELHCAIGLTLTPKGATTFSSTVRLVRALGEELFVLSYNSNAFSVGTLLEQNWPASRAQTTPESLHSITPFPSCLHLQPLGVCSSCDNFNLNELSHDLDHLDHPDRLDLVIPISNSRNKPFGLISEGLSSR